MLCALGGTRTHNLLIRSQMLYPIGLRALELQCRAFKSMESWAGGLECAQPRLA